MPGVGRTGVVERILKMDGGVNSYCAGGRADNGNDLYELAARSAFAEAKLG